MRGWLVLLLLLGCRGAAAYEPQINYMLHCMGCHTPDGSGEPGRVPDMKPTLVPFAASPDGRRYLVQVPGASQSQLSNAELADLLNWMIQNLSLTKPSRFTHYTEAEVASYRGKTLVAVRATRERLMQSLTGASAPKP
ncbi:MAG TPA: hypothetical protein VHB68_01505 [Steroidobacteraceae bacterium]|nr:hypothetical protein [Steroidobacteraceae bacterium]